MSGRSLRASWAKRLGGDGLHQVLVHLDRIDGADPQAWQVGHQPQDAHHQIPQLGRRGKVRTPTGQVDAG